MIYPAKPLNCSKAPKDRGHLQSMSIALGFMSYQSLVLLQQLLLSFRAAVIQDDAVYGTHLLALRLMVMPNAFGTQARVYDVNFLPLTNSFVGAFRLTDITVNAVISNF